MEKTTSIIGKIIDLILEMRCKIFFYLILGENFRFFCPLIRHFLTLKLKIKMSD